MNPYSETKSLGTLADFIQPSLHLLAGEGVWGRGRRLSPLPQLALEKPTNWRNIPISLIDLGLWRTNGANWCKCLIVNNSGSDALTNIEQFRVQEMWEQRTGT